jgi:hypothetical protein
VKKGRGHRNIKGLHVHIAIHVVGVLSHVDDHTDLHSELDDGLERKLSNGTHVLDAGQFGTAHLEYRVIEVFNSGVETINATALK